MCAQQNRKCIRNLLAALIGVTLSVTAFAQTFPTKPIRLIVTFAAGSTADVVARAIAQPMAQTLGQPVVVENKPGAGGGIGITAVAQSPKDGYTIGIGTSASMAINPSLAKGTPYDPIADLTPIALIALVPNILVAGPGMKGDTLPQIIAFAKANPDQIYYASSGVGTVNHLLGELLQARTGIKMIHTPYKGNQDPVSDLMAGRVQLMFTGLPPIQGLIKSGKLRAIAVGGKTRLPSLPDTPTMAEAGIRDLEAVSTFSLVGPTGMPREAVDRINAAAVKALALPDVSDRLRALGAEPASSTPQGVAAMLADDLRFWKKQIKDLNIKED